MCTCLSQVVLKAFKHLAHCYALYRTIYWLIFDYAWTEGIRVLFIVTSIRRRRWRWTCSNESIVYSGFFNLFSKHAHTHSHKAFACLPIFSTGICETRCALNTQFICSMKFISLWLFNGFFFSLFLFSMLFSLEQRVLMSLLCCFILLNVYWFRIVLSLFRLLVYRHSSLPFRRNRFKWAHVWKCSHINI